MKILKLQQDIQLSQTIKANGFLYMDMDKFRYMREVHYPNCSPSYYVGLEGCADFQVSTEGALEIKKFLGVE